MRDLLVTGIVLGALPFIFRNAWIGVLLWTWLSLMNPHKLAWGFATNAPFAALAAGVTLIGLVTTKGPVSLPKSSVIYFLIAFILWMGLTTAFSIYPELSLEQYIKVLKIQLMTLVALALLHEKKHIQLFVWVNVLSIGFFGVKGGIYTIQTAGGGRVWGPGGFIGGNNEIGLAMLITIPLMYYLYLTSDAKWIKRGLMAAMLLTAVAVLGTQSRGAFLAIAAMGFVLWLRSPHKANSAFFIVVIAAVLLAFMPDSWFERMGTIRTYQEDGSAMGRITAWKMTFNLANDLFFGGGFYIYTPFVYALYQPDFVKSVVAHSIYFSVLGEHGWVGLGLFLTIWFLVWRDAASLRKRVKGVDDLLWVHHLAGMCQVALVGYLVGGAFLSLAYYDYPYNLLVIIAVTQRWLLAHTQVQT
ncbi:putative O-glycosylation ligase, exosortase A system-associated [Thauera sp. JM12B12]|uniref:putative O-glycosylation ligase, exosortase A system-associated n=1 Tax=Thauera sp. JM12B12 TaxID=3142262 RepID=UPI0031F38A13